ncbi:MAG: hypothetical protein Q9162_002390 [Coniocarpon cinnabarinum]
MATPGTDQHYENVGDNIWRNTRHPTWFDYLTDEGNYVIKVVLHFIPHYDVSFGKRVVKEYHRFEDHHQCFKVRTAQRAANEGREMPTMLNEDELKVPEDEHREFTNGELPNGELLNGEHAHHGQ